MVTLVLSVIFSIKIFTSYEFKPQYFPFWRTRVPLKFFHRVFYNKPMIINRINSPRKSNSEIFIHIYLLSSFLAKKNTCPIEYIFKHPHTKKLWFVEGAVASWLMRSTPERVVRIRTLVGDFVLCSCVRHFTLTVPLSTHVYKWVLAN